MPADPTSLQLTDPEDAKLVTLARSTRARTRAATVRGILRQLGQCLLDLGTKQPSAIDQLVEERRPVLAKAIADRR